MTAAYASGTGGPGASLRPDGTTGASASAIATIRSRSRRPDGTVDVVDSETGRVLAALSGQTGAAYSVDFSPDASRLVSGGADGRILVWDWRRRVKLLTLTGHRGAVLTVLFASNGRRVVSAG